METKRKVIRLKSDQFILHAMGFVNKPAIEMNWLAFSKVQSFAFAIQNPDKHIVTGPALVPNVLIPRINPETNEEFDVYFTEEDCRLIFEKFLIKKHTDAVTLNHEVPMEDINLIELWMVDDPEMDKSKHLGYSVPKGTIMTSYKVDNEDMWNRILNKEVNGFSIEGGFVGAFAEQYKETDPEILEINDMLKTVDEKDEDILAIEKIINEIDEIEQK